MTKTFNIGESAVGGTVKCTMDPDNRFVVQCIDDKKEIILSGIFTLPRDYMKLFVWLGTEVTSSYYADKILDHFKIKNPAF